MGRLRRRRRQALLRGRSGAARRAHRLLRVLLGLPADARLRLDPRVRARGRRRPPAGPSSTRPTRTCRSSGRSSAATSARSAAAASRSPSGSPSRSGRASASRSRSARRSTACGASRRSSSSAGAGAGCGASRCSSSAGSASSPARSPAGSRRAASSGRRSRPPCRSCSPSPSTRSSSSARSGCWQRPPARRRDLLPGVIVGRSRLLVLQALGGWYVDARSGARPTPTGSSRRSSACCPGCRSPRRPILISAEIDAVRVLRLWPRSLRGPMTAADRRALEGYARGAQHDERAEISVTWRE